MTPTAKAQIKYLELLRENGLLDLALEGKLPAHVEKAAKQYVIADMRGAKVNEEKTTLQVTADEHTEAQREVEEYLSHYRLTKEIEASAKEALFSMPREFRIGKKYVVTSGYFEGRVVVYVGTDLDVFGVSWMDNYGHPACEKFLFRAQRDGVDVSGRVLVFKLPDEHRDILLHEKEVGSEVN